MRELLTERFLSRCSAFPDALSFLAAGGLQPADLLALDPLRARRWDLFVRSHTAYPDWRRMLGAAGAEWMIGRLGIIIDD